MTANLDRDLCELVPFQRVGESLIDPRVTGYGLLGNEASSIPSITDDQPETKLLYAGLHSLASFSWVHDEPWPMHGTTLGIATSIGLPSVAVGDRAMVSALARIAEMAQLPQNWDGDDADPPTGTAVAEACHLVVLVRTERLERGRLDGVPITSSPLPDGGLQVEWQSDQCRIDVQVNADGSYGFLTKFGSGQTAQYEEADDVQLADIIELIHQVLDN